MSEKPIINIPIIVEGKYDKIKLASIVEARIITTDGFGLFRQSEKLELIRRLAEKNGIIILTDSDGAGLVIRNHLRSSLPAEKIINLYTPRIEGKEKRKKTPSRSGVIGIEGMDADLLREMLLPYSDGNHPVKSTDPVSKTDFYNDGLSGSPGSSEKRKNLAEKLSLPPELSANALLEAINLLYTKEEYKEFIK